MKEIRVGVVNWDCSLPRETFFGYYQLRTLSPRKYRTFTPYYADILGDDLIDYHVRDQKEFDRELCYAIDAGIDYFAYVYYPRHGSRAHISLKYSDVSHRVYELAYARTMHASSRYRHKIGMAMIINPMHPMLDEDIAELVAYFREPYYEKIDNRPLVYLYQSSSPAVMRRILTACVEDGVPAPYFVPMIYPSQLDEDRTLIDAVSQYACAAIGVTEYDALCDFTIAQNQVRLEFGHRLIPTFTTGWNPSPRIDIPCPWCEYAHADYPMPATGEELIRGAHRFADWICEKAADAFVGHIMTFAWNEFEEGAWICPTYREDLQINEERIRAFAEISAYWKRRLSQLIKE